MNNDPVQQDALMKLWEADKHARDTQGEFWRLADNLVQQGSIRAEDVAVVYGCSAATARNHMRNWSTWGQDR